VVKALKMMLVVALVGSVGAACTNSGDQSASPPPTGTPRQGGTLHLASVAEPDVAAFDPAKEYYQTSFELLKCCLLRTLYSTNGKAVEQHGSDLMPDLAAAAPQVSVDGLTWTFRIKQGVHYAPPMDQIEITAPDFIRALEREADPAASTGGYSFYYSPIQGFDAYGAGKAPTITGLAAPDPYTLVVQLTAPTGDLGWRMALPATAPIPPFKDQTLGVAEGHTKDYGRFLVGSGPYMFEGADQVDYALPASKQTPVSGYVPGRSVVLVRNPAYDPATDGLRPAYVDRIEIQIGGTAPDLYNQVQAGTIDYVLDALPPPDVLRTFSLDPALRNQLFVNKQNAVTFTAFNLGVPPFDDIHVRKAVNWAIDKAGARQLSGGDLVGTNAGHIFPDGLLNNVLLGYDPYATPGDHGDLTKAKAEMAQSKYAGPDGLCDAPACKDIIALTAATDPGPKIADLWAQNLAPLGMTLDIKALSASAESTKCTTLPDRVPTCLDGGWLQDYPDALTIGAPLFSSASLYPGCCNYSAIGASPEQLRRWGYSVTSVPSLDGKIAACSAIVVGDARTQCWADMDKYLMEDVVPFAPKTFPNDASVVSAHVTNYSFDEFSGMAAIDHFAVSGTSS
jgi:peptide/nickel transport system substrate-binding protein